MDVESFIYWTEWRAWFWRNNHWSFVGHENGKIMLENCWFDQIMTSYDHFTPLASSSSTWGCSLYFHCLLSLIYIAISQEGQFFMWLLCIQVYGKTSMTAVNTRAQELRASCSNCSKCPWQLEQSPFGCNHELHLNQILSSLPKLAME